MGAKTRLRARWVERGVNENMFGVLLVRVCVCQITISYEGNIEITYGRATRSFGKLYNAKSSQIHHRRLFWYLRSS